MRARTDRILALCLTGTALWIGVVAAAPTEKNSGLSPAAANFERVETVIELGAPETDAGISPSAPPDLERATASSWEGQAPSAIEDQTIPTGLLSPSSPDALYQINWQTISDGGDVSTSANFTVNQTVGQEAISAPTSAGYSMGQGYWYGAPVSANPPSCACDCHGNPVCDAAICDVLDVVSAVTVAFRNGAALTDPNANCPYERTDVDCSTFTDVIDVVKIVTVAFRNGNPATEFCNPCP